MANIQVGKIVQYNGQVFERIRVLGKGSFGTAIVHKRQHDNALVVLKEIDLVKLKREADRLSAIQEARIMSNLSHQNIIKYYNAYSTDTKLIIEMEYARLGNLQSYLIYQNRLLGEREVFQIFRRVLFGIDYLHSKKIVHLDLKMANIFVTSEGSIKIGDFGIAKFINSSSNDDHCEDNTRGGGIEASGSRNPCHYHVGTLAYSSPERCLGGKTDFKSDIWSLGCILYELATLKPLFASESLAELVLSITRVQYEPIQRPDIRPTIKSLFEKMISRQPSDRPTSSELVSLTDQILLQIDQLGPTKRRQPCGRLPLPINNFNHHMSRRYNEVSGTDAMALNAANPFQLDGSSLIQSNPINYKHSLLYQVRLDSHDIQVERVNLPQSKRIREIAKGRSHYLVLTYDDIVYGWGSKHKGQLGACNLFKLSQQQQHLTSPRPLSLISRGDKAVRHSQSARASFTARDLHNSSPAFWTSDARNLLSCSPYGGCTTSGRAESTILSLTQPPSLSSSTQTILAPNGQPQRQSLSNLVADYQARRGQEQQFALLASSQPAIRPIVISELNKRRICRIAAGRDFSVFLSRTGIVLTCGDGSRGCLGRGNIDSSFMPRMVDKLLNMDVVSIACGPEHVVAICSNGQAFAWGNSQYGQLGVSLSDVDCRDVCANRYVTRPQLISFHHDGQVPSESRRERQTTDANGSDVFIKSAHCGDRCTLFIDSNQQVWACGHNQSNRLGLDRVRRFKRTVIVEHSLKPVKVAALSKERILYCSIGKNHASYITREGKMLVLGQDIDHSYRLRMELASDSNNESLLKRGANGLLRLSSSWSLTSNQVYLKRHTNSTGEISESIKKIDHESLLKSLLDNNRLRAFKTTGPISHINHADKSNRTSRFAKNQIEIFLRKSRAIKRLTFDGVMATSSTSKFTLVLTNDNRVYFWGIRTHESGDSDGTTRQIGRSTGPRLVPSHLDECFIKIGSANSSLMNSIQVLGSDQPIILARNPQLTARSLKDLWILDYEPLEESQTSHNCSPSSSISSLSEPSCESHNPRPHKLPDSCARSPSKGSYVGPSGTGGTNSFGAAGSSCSSLQSLEHTTTSLYSCCSNDEYREDEMNHFGNSSERKRYDAIIEPQPIVSLYVPSMFNHSGCSLQLVNLFCFDEDRFFLVLDTTVKYHGQSNLTPTIETSVRSSATQRRNSVSHRHPNNKTNQMFAMQQTSRKLNIVEEPKSCGSSSTKPKSIELDPHSQLASHVLNQEDVSHQNLKNDLMVSSNHIDEDNSDRSHGLFDRLPPVNRKNLNETSLEVYEADELTGESNGALTQESQQISPISNNCFSLEEPVSLSTFAPGFDGNNIAILGRESPKGDCESLRRLSFEKSQQVFECELDSTGSERQLAPERQEREKDYRLPIKTRQNHHRRRLFMRTRNQSESTVVTGSFEDDTTSMPTWVKNEYNQQMFSLHDKQNNQVEPDNSQSNISANTLIEPKFYQNQEEPYSMSGSRSRLIAGSDGCDYDIVGNLDHAPEISSRRSCCVGSVLRSNDSASEIFTDANHISNQTQQTHRLSLSQPELRDIDKMISSSSAYTCTEIDYKLMRQNLLDCHVYSREGSKNNYNSVGVLEKSLGLSNCSFHEIHHQDTNTPHTVQIRDFTSAQMIGSSGIANMDHMDLDDHKFGLVCSLTEEKSSAASKVSMTQTQSAEGISVLDNFDQDLQNFGLKRNLLSRSVNLGSDFYSRERSSLVTSNMNNNLHFDDNVIKVGTRRLGGSRSSLGSIRKSFAKLFC